MFATPNERSPHVPPIVSRKSRTLELGPAIIPSKFLLLNFEICYMPITNEDLRKAIELVNSTRRRCEDPSLVYYVTCTQCSEGFAKLAQDFKLAEKRGYAHRCPQ